jgi:catechol 2,3-dioxygenase-like lactoylglutathione lyase family enzyme
MAMTNDTPLDAERPFWRGINHLALVTNDMDATVRFWHGVLGARLVAHLGNEHFRHYFFEFGVEQTVAFFEYKGVHLERFQVPAGVPDRRKAQFDHLSFNLPDEHALEELQTRLKSHGSEVTDVVDHGFVRSIYFNDPNGIALEASWWVVDPTGRPSDYADPGLFSDPDPVPAVRELVRDGKVGEVPHTTLETDEIVDPV